MIIVIEIEIVIVELRIMRKPQLIFIHTHQLFRIQYTLFYVGTANIFRWWCMNYCRVRKVSVGRSAARPRPVRPPAGVNNDNNNDNNV